ncbi:unnamed protein product, partial [Symbiodinium sp. KB8]
KIKCLGIIISYSNYELLTLRHRLAEAGKKIQQVCQRWAFPLNQLDIFEAGMLTSFAQCLTSQAAHVTHVTTADLLKLHKLQDPVDKIRRMKGRITKLRKRSRAVADAAADVALHSHILIDLDRILQEAQALPVATQATLAPAHHCHICQAAFDTEHGLRMHTSKMHRDSLSRLLLENGSAVIDLDRHSPPTAAWPAAPTAETWSNKRRRHEEPGPSSAHVSQSPSELDKQRQESVATALRLYANPQEAGIKLLLPPFMDITDNPFTHCPTENMATCCLRSKWAPFAVFGQLLDGLPSESMQDSRHSSPSIDQPSNYKSIFFGA